MGYLRPMGSIPSSSFAVMQGIAVPVNSATKGVFMDLQKRTNALMGYYYSLYGANIFGVLAVDGLIGPNTVSAVQDVASRLEGAGLDSFVADAASIAANADSLAATFGGQQTVFGAPDVSAPSNAPKGGGSGSAPPPAAVVAKTPPDPGMFGAITKLFQDPSTGPYAIAGLGLVAALLFMKSKKGKRRGARRPRRGVSRARRATRRTRVRRGRR